mgnify:CR=1 FL=1
MKLNLSIIILFIYFSITPIFAFENKILLKINNNIVTSVDILNEVNYLNSINSNLKNLEKNKVYEIARNSIIRERIKEIALVNFFKKIDLEEEVFNRVILNNYSNVGIKTINELREHLKNYNITLGMMKKKVSINTLWNTFIYDKFSKNVKINVDEIKKDLLKDDKQKEFNLSEIVFNLEINENLDTKIKIIKKSILEKGFENSAAIYSISDTATKSGSLGWVKESSINPEILKEFINIDINEYSNVIKISSGFLILKINEIRETERIIDLEKELEIVIREQTNNQLNQFSNLYLNKMKKNIVINEI